MTQLHCRLACAYMHIHLRLWQIVILLAFPVVLEPTTTFAVGCGCVSSITILTHHASIASNLSCTILNPAGHAGNGCRHQLVSLRFIPEERYTNIILQH